MGTHRKTKSKKKGKRGRTAAPYSFDFRLKVVKLYLEDGYPAPMIVQQFGISDCSIYKWCKRYRQHGEQGLINRMGKSTGSTLSGAVTAKILALKKENPGYGIRRISDILKRFFLIKASPSTVRRVLCGQGLTTPVKKKPKKNPAKPRFF